MSAPTWTPAVRRLGAFEAHRMLRHPAYPIAMLYILTWAGTLLVNHQGGTPANGAYMVVSSSLLLVYAPVTFVVTNRVAAATHRSRVREVLDSVPVDVRQRTLGAIVGLMRGPVVVGLAGAALLLVLGRFVTALTPVAGDRVYQRTVLEYLQVPAIVLGAGLLGIAVARWLPWPGMLPLTTLVLWFGTMATYFPFTAVSQSGGPEVVHARTWLSLWPVWYASDQGMLPRQPLGQEMWHLSYLLGLGTLAGFAALLRAGGPRRALFVTAGAVVAVTAAAAWLQLG
ncbi:hypothetical protein [Actinoplanes sp. NPDC026619]|uniref:hypothetical protein n=1 Tax=Actinoplanes sp. NPDC026619 TaxID=3155798 RepID=UPI0033DAF9B6